MGVKKIYDLGVFTITCTCSLLAYVWIFICLIDYEVTAFEAVLTLSFMPVLLIFAYAADVWKQAQTKKLIDQKFGVQPSLKSMKEPSSTTKYSPVEFYQTLLPLEMGKPVREEDLEKAEEMKAWLAQEFQTSKIHHVDENDLKMKI